MALGGGFAEVAKLVAQLDLKDNFTRPLSNADRQLSAFQRSGEQLGHGIRQVGTGLTTLGIRAGVVAAGGLTAVVKTAVDFESAFAGVAKTVDATGPELDALEQGFFDLSKTIPLSVEELEAIGEQAGALGIAKGDILAFTDTVAKIGATTNVSSDQAATALGQLQNVLGLTADEFDNFGAALVDLGNKGASTESQILDIASRAGAGSSLIGIAADATLGWASAVANLGVQTEAGGSALQQFFLQAAKNLTIGERLALMAKTAGVTGSAFKKAFAEDANGALQLFLQGLGKLPQAARLSVLDDAGLKGIRLQRVLLGLAGDSDNLSKSLATASDAWQKNTALEEEFGKRQATTESALKVLVNNVRLAANTIGSELLPVVRDLSAEFVDFLNKPGTQQQLRDFAKGLASGIKGFVEQFRSGQFDQIIESIKGAAGVMKVAFDAFNALPGPLKSALIAGAVVNRATGGALGLISSGLLNITKGVGGLLTRGNSPAAPLFVTEVGGVPGTGTTGGLGGGLLGTLAKVTLVGGAMVAAAEGLRTVAQTLDPGSDARKQAFTESGGGFLGLEGFFRDLFSGKTPGAATPLGQFDPRNAGGTPAPVRVTNVGSITDPITGGQDEAARAEAQGFGDLKRTLELRLRTDKTFKPEVTSAEQFIRLLRRTSEFGAKGTGTRIEEGPTTGRDPFGKAFLALVRRLDDHTLANNRVQGEIRRHITAARELLRIANREGDRKAQQKLQATIEALRRILGVEREGNTKQDRTRREVTAGSQKTSAILREIKGDTNSTARSSAITSQKDFSPEVNVSVPITTYVSVSDIVRASYEARFAANVPTGFSP